MTFQKKYFQSPVRGRRWLERRWGQLERNWCRMVVGSAAIIVWPAARVVFLGGSMTRQRVVAVGNRAGHHAARVGADVSLNRCLNSEFLIVSKYFVF